MREGHERKPPFPPGVRLGIGSALMVAAAFVAAATGPAGSLPRLAVMALAVGVGAALIPDWRYGAGLAVIGYLLYVGFLVNQYGELHWEGHESRWRWAMFVLAFWLGLVQRWLRRGRYQAHGSERQRPAPDEADITRPSR